MMYEIVKSQKNIEQEKVLEKILNCKRHKFSDNQKLQD